MSASQFSDTIKNHIFELYKSDKLSIGSFQNASRLSIFNKYDSTKKLRTAYESASSGHTSIVTQSGINSLMASIHEGVTDIRKQVLLEKIFSNFNYKDFINNWVPAHVANANVSKVGAGYAISNVPQDVLKNTFIDYLGAQAEINGIDGDELLKYASDHIQSGHLAGVFTLKTALALGVNVDMSSATNYRDFKVSMSGSTEETKEYTNLIDKVLKLLLDADYVTSNLTDNVDIFANATKSVLGTKSPFLSTELQYKKDNQAAGDLLQQAGRQLNNIISSFPAKSTGTLEKTKMDLAFKKFISELGTISDMLLQKSAQMNQLPLSSDLKNAILGNAAEIKKIGEVLINTKGSPSIKESILQNAASMLKNGKVLPTQTTKVSVKQKQRNKDNTAKDINKTLKEAAKAVKKAKDAIDKEMKKQASIKLKASQAQAALSLSSLQILINTHLQDVVSANMGNGSSKNVLNYRTGRLASSANVEKLTQGREGMITAFYSYMKNPYATFSDGGKQQYPKSRDPKLLISKSIREIAMEAGITRMRSVVV